MQKNDLLMGKVTGQAPGGQPQMPPVQSPGQQWGMPQQPPV